MGNFESPLAIQCKDAEIQLRMSIISYGFTGWGGGIDFIRYLLSCAEPQSSEVDQSNLLMLPKDNFWLTMKSHLAPKVGILRQMSSGKWPTWTPRATISQEQLTRQFAEFEKHYTTIWTNSSLEDQLEQSRASGADVALPCIFPAPIGTRIPWVGYLADFQNCHLPQFFSSKYHKTRSVQITNMLSRARHILVNAEAVVQDAKHFYPGYPSTLHALPFSPCPNADWLDSRIDYRVTYGMDKPYFIICNQFWKHKDHRCAFLAFAQFIAEGGDANLVCTGLPYDPRFPELMKELQQLLVKLGIEKSVKILGRIEKLHQIYLMKHSIAVLQPTNFEGGPGGGAGYDSVALGVPLILSDISVNKEISEANVHFFETSNSDSLKLQMQRVVNMSTKRSTNFELLKNGLARKIKCKQKINEITRIAVQDF